MTLGGTKELQNLPIIGEDIDPPSYIVTESKLKS